MVLIDLWPFFSFLVLSSPSSCATCIPYILSAFLPFPHTLMPLQVLCNLCFLHFFSRVTRWTTSKTQLKCNPLCSTILDSPLYDLSTPNSFTGSNLWDSFYFSALYFITVPLIALIGSNSNHYMPQWDYQFLRRNLAYKHFCILLPGT